MTFTKRAKISAAAVASAAVLSATVATPLAAEAQGGKKSDRYQALCERIGGTNEPVGTAYCDAPPLTSFTFAEVGVLETYCASIPGLVLSVGGNESTPWPGFGYVYCGQNH